MNDDGLATPPHLNEMALDWPVYAAIGLSGLSALAAEVIWTRLLSLFLGPTVYTFSIILACFLVGIGLGSAAGAWLSRLVSQPRLMLTWCQLLLTAAIASAAFLLDRVLPQQLYSSPNDLLSHFWFDLTRAVVTILPAASLWGASFPLALAAAARRDQDPGRLVGGVYATNTVGAIVGATATSLFLLPWLGTQGVQRALIWISALAAALLFVPWCQPLVASVPPTDTRRISRLMRLGALPLLATAVVAWLLVRTVVPVPGLLVAIGKFAANWQGRMTVIYVGEGISASVAVSQSKGVRAFHVNGEVEASTDRRDMQLQRMLAALPALIHSAPRSVLVVGCGAGVTAGSFVPYSAVDRLTIVEIEPLIPQVVAEFFRQENNDVVHDPRVVLVYDDARHYVLTTPEQFDVITSDPIRPWVKGSASLYTKEYFELVKRHLSPGGVVSQWVPLYESTLDVVRSELATFVDVFPEATIWSNEPSGNDLVLVGQVSRSSIDVDAIQQRLERSAAVAASLQAVGFSSAIDLVATYTGRGPELKRWLTGAEINRDRNLRLQYRAALRLAPDEPEDLYASLINRRRYPANLFVASAATKDTLLAALRRRPTGGR